MTEPVGKTIGSVLGTFRPVILSYGFDELADYKPGGTNIQSCPFCDSDYGQDNIKTNGHWVNRCQYCGLIWEWRLERNGK